MNRVLYFFFAKRLDTLIIRQFFGPFLITFSVVTFVLLIQMILKYIEDFAGKGLDLEVYGKLFYYLGLNVMPRALPLAVLLSSLMTFGGLGQHNELTAIKSAGISLLRIQWPVFVLVCFMAVGAHLFHDNVVPYANLKAYSLLYDIKHKKPAFDLKEGAFYNGITGYSIKVEEKGDDGKTIKDVMIYDHTEGRGNTELTVADSGQMYMINNDKYLVIDLYNGIRHAEQESEKNSKSIKYSRSKYEKSKVIFDLSSFQLANTPEELFRTNRMMRNAEELRMDIDSLEAREERRNNEFDDDIAKHFRMPFIVPDSLEKAEIEPKRELNEKQQKLVLENAYKQAVEIKKKSASLADIQQRHRRDSATLAVELIHKYSDPVSCLIMFLIGAPIGAILKKGGLGIPALITIVFFIFFYVISSIGEKIARADMLNVYVGTWASNMLLLPIGLFLLYQSSRDASLFEYNPFDFFKSLLKKMNNRDKR